MSYNKRKELRVILIVFGLAVVSLAWAVMYTMLKSDYQLYQQESECVQTHITQGVERRNIVTEGGTCYVKSNKS